MQNSSEEFVSQPRSIATPHRSGRFTNTAGTFSLVKRFLLVGGGSTVIGFSLIYGLIYAGLGAEGANLLGYAIMIPLSYVAHARISFRRRKIKAIPFWKYILAVLLSYSLNFAALVAMTKFVSVNSYLVQIPAFATYALAFFCLNRWFVFAE